jgi:replication-associated recombination protein RarA
MRLYLKYRPKSLGEIVGHPPIRLLREFVSNPYPACFLLEGSGPGTGKTATAYALATDLGCVGENGVADEFGGCWTVIASDLLIENTRTLFEQTLRLRPMYGSGWRALVIEELERLNDKVQVYLKVALERLPPRTVVVATSNDASRIDRALLQRFRIYGFNAGLVFAECARERLAEIWKLEAGDVDMPSDWLSWGWIGNEFSMRVALEIMQEHLSLVMR